MFQLQFSIDYCMFRNRGQRGQKIISPSYIKVQEMIKSKIINLYFQIINRLPRKIIF